MTCTTCNKGEVTKHTQLKICDECYKKKVGVARKSGYERKFKSLPRRQERGTHGGVSATCWNKYCKKPFRAARWQNPKFSFCPKCKKISEDIGVGLE